MEAPKEYGRIVMELLNCAIAEEKLLDTPSRKHGIGEVLERDLRVVGCMYIQSAGLLLKLPQVAMATAQVLFQRFYYSKSFVNYSVQYMAAASIFVAAKVEEAPRRLRDIINVFHHLRQKRTGRSVQPMDYMGNTYFKVKGEIIQCEKYLLKTLGLCVHVQHPHKLIITILQVLEMEKNSSLVQRVWNYMNDSLRTNVFVRFSPSKIACACIFLAAREFKIPLPSSPGWWLMFDVSREDVEVISLEILQLYTYPSRTLEDVEKEVGRIKEELAKKKQVDVREVQLSSALSSRNGSPSKGSPLMVSDSKRLQNSTDAVCSPAIEKLASQNGDSKQNSSSPLVQSRKRSRSSTSDERPLKRSRSQSPTIEKLLSASGESANSPSGYRPILSPIRLAHSSSDNGPSSNHNSPANQLPRKYQNKYDNHKHKKQHRRRSREEKGNRREKHHSRRHSRDPSPPPSRGHSKLSSRNNNLVKHRHHNSTHRGGGDRRGL